MRKGGEKIEIKQSEKLKTKWNEKWGVVEENGVRVRRERVKKENGICYYSSFKSLPNKLFKVHNLTIFIITMFLFANCSKLNSELGLI